MLEIDILENYVLKNQCTRAHLAKVFLLKKIAKFAHLNKLKLQSSEFDFYDCFTQIIIQNNKYAFH